jgi:hypothetical protein
MTPSCRAVGESITVIGFLAGSCEPSGPPAREFAETTIRAHEWVLGVSASGHYASALSTRGLTSFVKRSTTVSIS